MGWLTERIVKWTSDKQRAELEEFVALLRVMDGPEIGRAIALATHFRHFLEADGHHPMDPIGYAATRPEFAVSLSRTANDLERRKKPEATAFTIWMHTMRAGARPELRDLGRDMWRELSRGFPHVQSAARTFRVQTGILLQTDDADRFPAGLIPEPP